MEAHPSRNLLGLRPSPNTPSDVSCSSGPCSVVSTRETSPASSTHHPLEATSTGPDLFTSRPGQVVKHLLPRTALSSPQSDRIVNHPAVEHTSPVLELFNSRSEKVGKYPVVEHHLPGQPLSSSRSDIVGENHSLHPPLFTSRSDKVGESYLPCPPLSTSRSGKAGENHLPHPPLFDLQSDKVGENYLPRPPSSSSRSDKFVEHLVVEHLVVEHSSPGPNSLSSRSDKFVELPSPGPDIFRPRSSQAAELLSPFKMNPNPFQSVNERWSKLSVENPRASHTSSGATAGSSSNVGHHPQITAFGRSFAPFAPPHPSSVFAPPSTIHRDLSTTNWRTSTASLDSLITPSPTTSSAGISSASCNNTNNFATVSGSNLVCSPISPADFSFVSVAGLSGSRPASTLHPDHHHFESVPIAENNANMHPQTGKMIADGDMEKAMCYCYDRGGGQFTRLVPVDMLPVDLQDIPRRVNTDEGMIVLPVPRQPGPDGQLANIQLEPQRVVTHEMPHDRETQEKLGLFHGYPAWWKKQVADQQRPLAIDDRPVSIGAGREGFPASLSAGSLGSGFSNAVVSSNWRAGAPLGGEGGFQGALASPPPATGGRSSSTSVGRGGSAGFGGSGRGSARQPRTFASFQPATYGPIAPPSRAGGGSSTSAWPGTAPTTRSTRAMTTSSRNEGGGGAPFSRSVFDPSNPFAALGDHAAQAQAHRDESSSGDNTAADGEQRGAPL
ncbi:hypothetical protein diail_9675 [Diaporthe ilicicola]|nr:hypothetical protein diail_9675 [Diaporthe ilicicola]